MGDYMIDSYLREAGFQNGELAGADTMIREVAREDPVLQQKRDMHGIVQEAAPEQLGRMLEMLQELGIGKMGGQDSAPYQQAGSTR